MNKPEPKPISLMSLLEDLNQRLLSTPPRQNPETDEQRHQRMVMGMTAGTLIPLFRGMLNAHLAGRYPQTREVAELLHTQGLLLSGQGKRREALSHFKEALDVMSRLDPDSNNRRRIEFQRRIDQEERALGIKSYPVSSPATKPLPMPDFDFAPELESE